MTYLTSSVFAHAASSAASVLHLSKTLLKALLWNVSSDRRSERRRHKEAIVRVYVQSYSHSPALSIAVVKLFGPKILRNFKHLAPPKKIKCINRTFGEKKAWKFIEMTTKRASKKHKASPIKHFVPIIFRNS